MKSKMNQTELLNQFKTEIATGTYNLDSYDDVSKMLEKFIKEFPNEKSMTMIFELIGTENVHLEHWLNCKFDCLEKLPESQRAIIVNLYQTVFTKRMLNSFRYLYIHHNSLPKLLMHMELFPLMEMWFNTNIPKAHIDSDELVTNMCDLLNDVYGLDKTDFEKIYSNYAEDNLAA
jgi:hypothetical protein